MRVEARHLVAFHLTNSHQFEGILKRSDIGSSVAALALCIFLCLWLRKH